MNFSKIHKTYRMRLSKSARKFRDSIVLPADSCSSKRRLARSFVAMSKFINFTKSESDIVTPLRKIPRRNRSQDLHACNSYQHYFYGESKQNNANLLKSHSLVIIKPNGLLNSQSSEELVHLDDLIPDTLCYNMPNSKEEAKEFVMALQATESAIQLKRTYPFTSMSNMEIAQFEHCYGEYRDDQNVINNNNNDTLMLVDEQGDCPEDESEEVLLMDEVVQQIHADRNAFQHNASELSVYDLDIATIMKIYDVQPDDQFE